MVGPAATNYNTYDCSWRLLVRELITTKNFIKQNTFGA